MKQPRILVVEDEAIVSMEIEERLTAMGYTVVGAVTSGEQALDFAREQHPDFVLMDIRLQGEMDGITAAEEIRKKLHLPVVFLTAYSEDSTLERAKRAEPYGYLLKPFDDRELKSAIEIALYKHRAEEELRRMNRLYDVLSQVNQAVVRAEAREELLDAVCRLVVERGAIDLAWIGCLDDASSHISPVAGFGKHHDLLEKAKFNVANSPEAQGNPVRAILAGQLFVCNDCGKERCFYPGDLAPSRFGFQSCASFPLSSQAEVFGALNICVQEPGFFREKEVKLFEEVAMDISFALDKIEENVRRMHVENALAESEGKFRRLFENIREMVTVYEVERDAEGRIVERRLLEANPAFLRAAGFSSSQDIRGKTSSQAFGESWSKDHLAAVQKAMDTGESLTQEVYRPESGRYYATSIVPLDANTYLGTAWDITDRKLVEDRLLKSERKFHSILDQAADAILVHDLQGWFLDVNQQACRSLGFSKEELLTMNVSDIDPEAIPSGKALLWQSIAEGKRFTFESRQKRRDASMFPVEITIGPIEVGDETLVLAIVRDITERKKAEQELRDSEARFKALHNASFGGIAIHDKGIILECNLGLSEITGYSEAELIGMDGLLLIAEQSRITVMQNILAGYEKPYEVFGLRKDGTEFPLRLEARNVPYKGMLVRSVEFRDISESKRAEEERKTLQHQLTQAQRLESVGRLAGGVAHDFNNMLGVILGHAELAMEELEPSHALFADLMEIRKAAERSADLTRQLLAFARRQAISPKILDLNETVAGMLKMLRRLIGENIDLAWLPAKDPWSIKVDPSQIDQILANLCVNARDAIAGVGKVTIETGTISIDNDYCTQHPGFMPGEFVMLAVSDDGCGMDKETIEKIFEPFYTTKGVGEGTGLGLSTVYGIVKQNNGYINAYSEPSQGTTIKIYLPRAREQTTEKPPVLVERDLRGQETVLLVEDEEPILALGKAILQRHGYEVLATNSPTEALGIVQSYPGPIHLLISDVVMPEMNGKDLRYRLAEIKPGFKSIFMSGYTANVIAHHGILDENVNFLQKPFSVQALLEKVRDVLDG